MDKSGKTQRLIADRLADADKATLRVLCWVVAALLTMRMISLPFLFDSVTSSLLFASAAGIVFYSAAILLGLKYDRIPQAFIRPLSVGLGIFVTGNVFLILYLTGGTHQLYFACLMLVTFGLAAASIPMLIAFMLPFLGLYIASLLILDVGFVGPYVAALIGAFAISLAIYFVHAPKIRNLIALQVESEQIAERLRQSNAAKDRFVANMTHELRTPMAGVLGMIDLLEEGGLDATQRHYVNTARKSARYLLTIVNDVLDIAKLEAGKLTLSPEGFDAVELTHDVELMFALRARQKGLDFKTDISVSDLPVLSGDQIRVGQILLNLLENALKFTPSGSITLGLELAVSRATGLTLRWSVRDTGIGIAQDRLTTLFDRFEQFDDSKTRTATGTGLGLAIVKELVDLMGGTLSVDSTVGEGSCFWVELPFSFADSPEAASAHGLHARFTDVKQSEYTGLNDISVEKNGATHPLGDHSLNILYAEDNTVLNALIGRLLAAEGWQSQGVFNGQEAVDALKEGPDRYDVVLMDIHMPEMDGEQALATIRSELNLSVPVIAVTANTLPDDVARYTRGGFNEIVGKPIDRALLRSAILRFTKDANQSTHPLS